MIYLNFILIINIYSLTRKVLFVLVITKVEFFQRKANFTYNPSSAISPAPPPFADIISCKLQGKPPLTSPHISYSNTNFLTLCWLPNCSPLAHWKLACAYTNENNVLNLVSSTMGRLYTKNNLTGS